MYQDLGGKAVLEKLVDDFYHIMQTDPAASKCLATHSGKEMKDSAAKLKAFLSGWVGGPPDYVEKYGHPRLRMRHFPFSIGQQEGEQWLYCMRKALEISTIPLPLQQQLLNAFEGVVKIIKNRD